ncbi:mannose/glucose-specific lectin isoform X2 [Hevea brasiliensis]|uniref:mannose/glucose-specific lectin isoform X2 n=1 Tax=Hevea brasiliensis TaxID=3981 RepID=UPI0025DA5F70|nr:mannose/glucose-specific lectin isoform X2 [Hevea brasiliensis]
MKKTLIAGPFGGGTGNLWDHGAHTTVRQLIIRSGMIVDCITVEYDENGCSLWSEANGHFGGSAHEIKLDYPDEYLTSISGHYNVYTGHIFISSLYVKSNKRAFGPFGTKGGNYFLVPSTAGKIVGFFGSVGPYLKSIGVHVEPIHPFKSIGPFGGNTGISWDDGVYTTIRRIIVASESIINSILIEYDKDGSLVSSSRHGGNNGGNTNVVELDYPDEYVTSISGYHGANSSPIVVQSLNVHTNRRVYGPFGVEKGKYFSFPPTEGKIIGFHGKCGAHLYSIGGHLEPTSDLYMVKTVGPFGAGNALSWDDEIHSAIKQIRIVHGNFVSSISTEYYNDGGSLVWSTLHGGDYESKIDTIKLDFPDEFLTSVTGYYDSVNEMNDYAFTSLTFQSNRRTYGPFGQQFGTYICFPSFDGKILGFHGRSSGYLYAIGAHVEPISYPKPSEFIGPFGGQGGDPWDDGMHTTIRQLVISCGSMVNYVCIDYDKNGHSLWSSKHGQSVGDKTYSIKLDYPEEFLISLSGSYSTNASSTIIQSLSFQSNKKTYGPFGSGKGNHEFSLSSIAYGKIIGFHGTCGDYLHSIGVYLKPIPMSYQYQTCEQCGGQGQHWDDGIHTTIRQLIIGAGSIVDSLHVEYDKHGRSLWSQKRGSSNGGSKYMVKLDYPAIEEHMDLLVL